MILSADFSWLELAPQPTLKSSSIAIVLSSVKSQKPESEADSLRMKQLVPKESAAENEMAEKQPRPSLSNKSGKSPDSVQSPTPIRPKKNLKALTLKKQTIKTIETVHSASIDTLHFRIAAEAKIGSPSNSGTNPPGFPISADPTFIKKTHNAPGGSSEPMTTAAAVPATEIPSDSPGINIARPLFKQNPTPDYPLRARRMGYEGLVMLKVLVDVNGEVEDLEVVSSSGYAILDKAARASVKKWMFEPGTEGGKKKKMWVKIPIRFELE